MKKTKITTLVLAALFLALALALPFLTAKVTGRLVWGVARFLCWS